MATITKLPSVAYRVQIRRKSRYASETFLRRDDACRWARQAETPGRSGPRTDQVVRGAPLDLSIAFAASSFFLTSFSFGGGLV